MEEEKKKAEQARKQLKSKPATAMVTRSKACKLPSSSSESDSESETLDLEKIMDDGVLHNTDAPNTAEDIMQKPNGNDVTDSASQNILQEDKANDTDGIASTSQNIGQDNAGNDKAANSHSHSVRKNDHEDQAEGHNIMQKTPPKDSTETLQSDSDSDDNMSLAALASKCKGKPKGKKKTGHLQKPKATPKKKKENNLYLLRLW